MSKKVREIYQVFDEASSHLAKQKIDLSEKKINELVSSLYSPGPSFQYVFNIVERKFEYVSPGVTALFGDQPETFVVEDFVNRFHPEGHKHFVHCEKITAYFLFSFIPKEEIPNYKISYQLRIKTADGKYKLFLHQAVAFTMDKDLKLVSSFANHSDISHITTQNNHKVSFINLAGGKSYYNISSIDDLKRYRNNHKAMSSREIEIIGLISEGFTSKEIADQLFISYDTVRTHRNNILKKTKCKTIPQVVGHYIREGLI